jgi:hypothetical protein
VLSHAHCTLFATVLPVVPEKLSGPIRQQFHPAASVSNSRYNPGL